MLLNTQSFTVKCACLRACTSWVTIMGKVVWFITSLFWSFNLEPRYQFTVRKAKHLEIAVLHHLATLTAKHDSREGISYIKYIHIPSQCVSLTWLEMKLLPTYLHQ